LLLLLSSAIWKKMFSSLIISAEGFLTNVDFCKDIAIFDVREKRSGDAVYAASPLPMAYSNV